MPTVDERVAVLEAKMDAIADLRGLMVDMRADLQQLRDEMNRRFVQIDQRFTQIDTCFTVMDAKVDRLFVWMIGLLAGGFTSVIGALIAVVYR